MKRRRKSRYEVTNKSGRSVVVLANNPGHAMALARREREWPNRGSDCEGDFGYSIDRVGKVSPV